MFFVRIRLAVEIQEKPIAIVVMNYREKIYMSTGQSHQSTDIESASNAQELATKKVTDAKLARDSNSAIKSPTTNAELLKLCERVLDIEAKSPVNGGDGWAGTDFDEVTNAAPILARALRDRIEGEDGDSDLDAARHDLAYCNGFDAGRNIGENHDDPTVESIGHRRSAALKIITRQPSAEATPQNPLRKDAAHHGSTKPQQNASNGVGIRSLPSVEAPPEPERVTITTDEINESATYNDEMDKPEFYCLPKLLRELIECMETCEGDPDTSPVRIYAEAILQRFGNRLGGEG